MSPDRLVRAGDLVLQKDIAERLRMHPTAVQNLATGRRRCGFPRPIIGKGNRGIWLWPEVEAWWKEAMPSTVSAQRAAAKTARMNDSWHASHVHG